MPGPIQIETLSDEQVLDLFHEYIPTSLVVELSHLVGSL